MNKEEIKQKIIKDGKECYLSAQEYAKLSANEKALIAEVIKGEIRDGKPLDPNEYERQMKALWPKEFIPKPLIWRRR